MWQVLAVAGAMYVVVNGQNCEDAEMVEQAFVPKLPQLAPSRMAEV
jgi:hypothetical protein